MNEAQVLYAEDFIDLDDLDLSAIEIEDFDDPDSINSAAGRTITCWRPSSSCCYPAGCGC
jgi:hypothetical protein